MLEINAMGDTCPIPVVKTKNAIKELTGDGTIAVLVDNEIAVQNLAKMAVQKQYGVTSEKLEEGKYRVILQVTAEKQAQKAAERMEQKSEETSKILGERAEADNEDAVFCIPDSRRNTVVVISSDRMGEGNEELGKVLMKGYLYALSKLEELPSTILFYNGGATLTTEGSDSLEDLKSLEALGVEILTCGTCLNYYNLTDKLAVGNVTNMYVIAETMSQADKIVKP